MSKYIKLEDAKAAFSRKYDMFDDWYETNRVLNSLPTIEVSEDCISREYILGEAFMSDEYNRETKSFDLPVVSVQDIKNAPSVTTEQSSKVGERK